MLRASLLFAAATAVAGCTCEPDADWYGDERFTAEERARIETGANWLYSRAGLPAPHISWTYKVTSAERLPQTIRRERGRADATGFCAPEKTLYLDPIGLPA